MVDPTMHPQWSPTWKNSRNKMGKLHIHLSNLCPPQGVLTLKRVTGMCGGKGPPFHAPSATPQDPLFSIFQFHKTLILTKNHKMFRSKCQTLANFQFLILKIGQNSIQEASVWAKKSVLKTAFCQKNQFNKPQNLAPIRSTNPHVQPFRPLTPTQTKVEYPPGSLCPLN